MQSLESNRDKTKAGETSPPVGTCRILWIDNNPDILRSGVQVLSYHLNDTHTHSYEIFGTETLDEGLSLIESCQEQEENIHLIICDLSLEGSRMADLDDLLRELYKRKLLIPVITYSGYDYSRQISHPLLQGHIRKPRFQLLFETVQNLCQDINLA